MIVDDGVGQPSVPSPLFNHLLRQQSCPVDVLRAMVRRGMNPYQSIRPSEGSKGSTIAGGTLDLDVESAGSSSANDPEGPFRVLTFNSWVGDYRRGYCSRDTERLGWMSRQLRDADPDVLCLQEVLEADTQRW